jgi:RNA polymerase sigma factor (sigma-70 family)
VGEEQARYDELYRAHHARIVRLCRLLLKDAQEAEEAAQEVFLKLVQASKVQNPSSAWAAWLTRVAVNACRDRQRSWWRRWLREDPRPIEACR